jgi:cysteinyl-tRNA synthetase
MSMIDDLTNAGGGMVDTVLGMTDLDDKLIAEATEKIGAENVEKLKEMTARLSDGSVSHDDIVATAKDMGVPETAIEMVIKFLGK